MMHEIAVELAAELQSQSCPVGVVEGPEPTKTTTYARERIVIEHDDSGDRFTAPRSQRQTPKHLFTRNVGAKVTIYAQAVGTGALPFEHRRRAEHILDLVVVALDKVIRTRRNAWTITSARFLLPDDLAASPTIGGAVYELAFSFERSVFAQTWAGDTAPTLEMVEGLQRSTTKVSITHGVDDDGDPTTPPITAETSCGA